MAGTRRPRVEYLKVLAIARLYLDNIENVQASWVTQGLKVLELGLHFGGNDVGSVMLEENVVKAAGTSNCTTEEELRRIIRDAGFKPVQRDTLYRTMFLNSDSQVRETSYGRRRRSSNRHIRLNRQHRLQPIHIARQPHGNIALCLVCLLLPVRS